MDLDNDLYVSVADVSTKTSNTPMLAQTELSKVLDFYNINDDEKLDIEHIEEAENGWAQKFNYLLTDEDKNWITEKVGQGHEVTSQELA